jgi:Trk-type K+ transport system membrane component
MPGSIFYVVIGVAIVVVLIGAAAWIRWRRGPMSRDENKIHPLLILGIVFLIPGLINLIQEGEFSSFLNMGIIFTLSGLAAQVLIKNQDDPQVRKVTLLSSLAGLLVGGVSGAVFSVFVEWPNTLTLILFCSLGLVIGMVFGRLYLHGNQV